VPSIHAGALQTLDRPAHDATDLVFATLELRKSRQSESPFSLTLIGFFCAGSSLVIDSLSLPLPFLVGLYVTVTVLAGAGLGGTVNAALSIEKSGLCFGPFTFTCNGPVPVLPTTTCPITAASPVVARLRLCGDTVICPGPGVGVAVGVAVAVADAVAVGVTVLVAVGVALLVAVADADAAGVAVLVAVAVADAVAVAVADAVGVAVLVGVAVAPVAVGVAVLVAVADAVAVGVGVFVAVAEAVTVGVAVLVGVAVAVAPVAVGVAVLVAVADAVAVGVAD
jgi:hypothetical protein